jgi:hypothetical protein
LVNDTEPAAQSAPATQPSPIETRVTPPLEGQPEILPESPRPQVTLSAPYSTTSWDDRDPERKEFALPLLYLHRQREETAEAERTLNIELVGMPAGIEIQVEAQSWHLDVSNG